MKDYETDKLEQEGMSLLIRVFRRDGSCSWVNPKYVAAVVEPMSENGEGTVILSSGVQMGYAHPTNLPELIDRVLIAREKIS